jgi:FixJ family two-component response regulator
VEAVASAVATQRATIARNAIFISGHADVHMCVQAMKAGAFEFLTKPIRHQELLDAIRPALSKTAYSSVSVSPSRR